MNVVHVNYSRELNLFQNNVIDTYKVGSVIGKKSLCRS